MLLEYLVTGRVRVALLRALWRDGARGGASTLSRLAGISFAAAHKELSAMESAGLVVASHGQGGHGYSTNPDYPEADLLRRLLKANRVPEQLKVPTPSSGHDHGGDEAARDFLAAHGAPLSRGERGLPVSDPERMVLACLGLARRDATVARLIPVVLWRLRGALDWSRLTRLAREQNQAHTLGFFLDLTGTLGADRRMVSLSRGLRDRRRTRPRLFFLRPHGPEALRTAKRNTPAPARRFGFIMNLGLDGFDSAFKKHAHLS